MCTSSSCLLLLFCIASMLLTGTEYLCLSWPRMFQFVVSTTCHGILEWVWRRMPLVNHPLSIYVICFCLRIVVSYTYCFVFLFYLYLSCALCTQNWQFLWIVHYWLPLRYSLTFMCSFSFDYKCLSFALWLLITTLVFSNLFYHCVSGSPR